jgi:hypothetical protein
MRVQNVGKLAIAAILLCAGNSFAQTGTTSAPMASGAAPAATPAAAVAPAPAPKPTLAAPAATHTSTVTKPYAPLAKPAEPAPAAITGPVWKKQVTRDVNMGEKTDTSIHRLRDANPDNTLLEMFAIGIKTGKVSSFYSSDFSMATRINVKDFPKLFTGRPDTVAVRDGGGKYVSKVTRKDFDYSLVHKYRVMEEWTSYPAMGKTEIQIVGIAPLKDIYGDDGVLRGEQPIFWVHYTDDIKMILSRYDQSHPNNTLGGHLWDDYFSTNGAQK